MSSSLSSGDCNPAILQLVRCSATRRNRVKYLCSVYVAIMWCVCCVCHKVYCIREADRSGQTHGYCPECFKKEMAKLDNMR
jgi:hypothetical protein